jgi:hypothetical protein
MMSTRVGSPIAHLRTALLFSTRRSGQFNQWT